MLCRKLHGAYIKSSLLLFQIYSTITPVPILRLSLLMAYYVSIHLKTSPPHHIPSLPNPNLTPSSHSILNPSTEPSIHTATPEQPRHPYMPNPHANTSVLFHQLEKATVHDTIKPLSASTKTQATIMQATKLTYTNLILIRRAYNAAHRCRCWKKKDRRGTNVLPKRKRKTGKAVKSSVP